MARKLPLPDPFARLEHDQSTRIAKLVDWLRIDLSIAELNVLYFMLSDLRSESPTIRGDSPASFMLKDSSIASTIDGLMLSIAKAASSTMKSPSFGDFNGDGKRDDLDVAILQSAAVQPTLDVSDRRRLDLTADDIVDSDDIATLMDIILSGSARP
jgi:hypothetical protein